MDDLAIICIIVGIFLILSRGSLIFAPDAMLRFYRKLLATNFRIRIMGIVFLILPLAMILAARGDHRDGAEIILGLGYLFGFVVVVFPIIFTSIYKLIADAFLDATDNVILRGLGAISLGIGIYFIYLGVAVFR
ncbi:MAG: hypothetical protein ISS66_18265 [Desulfobacteraceae bacterium]|nr:hypothetical protein [Desulfobacteraceae bacterium]